MFFKVLRKNFRRKRPLYINIYYQLHLFPSPMKWTNSLKTGYYVETDEFGSTCVKWGLLFVWCCEKFFLIMFLHFNLEKCENFHDSFFSTGFYPFNFLKSMSVIHLLVYESNHCDIFLLMAPLWEHVETASWNFQLKNAKALTFHFFNTVPPFRFLELSLYYPLHESNRWYFFAGGTSARTCQDCMLKFSSHHSKQQSDLWKIFGSSSSPWLPYPSIWTHQALLGCSEENSKVYELQIWNMAGIFLY